MKELSDLAARCIRCGFCLESCPTYVLTGRETESPRGRIYLLRSAEEGVLQWDESIKKHIDSCVGCLACTTACPSGVDYGQILEIGRDRLEAVKPNLAKNILLRSLSNPSSLRWQLTLSRIFPGRKVPTLLSRLLSGERPEAERPTIQRSDNLPKASPAGLHSEVYMLEGCAMRVLFPGVHAATRRLLARLGLAVRETSAGCCGALHAHNGYLDEARRRAARLVADMQEALPVVVNSAGCGATMKQYHELLGEAPEDRIEPPVGDEPVQGEGHSLVAHEPKRGFGARVFDLSEFLLAKGLDKLLASSPGVDLTVAYHDACHLAHGQQITKEPRALLDSVPGLRVVPLEESDMCCGSAGIYNLTQPGMARSLLERKWARIAASGAQAVVLGSPGCHAWIEQAAREHGSQVKVFHIAEVLEASFSGLPNEHPPKP